MMPGDRTIGSSSAATTGAGNGSFSDLALACKKENQFSRSRAVLQVHSVHLHAPSPRRFGCLVRGRRQNYTRGHA